MQELIQYFEALEARIAALESRVSELENRPAPEPVVVEKVVEKEVIVEKPVEVIKEVPVEKIVEKIVEKPVEISTSRDLEISKEPEPELPVEEPAPAPEPVPEPTPEPEPVHEEPASPKAAIYGKAVDDIRLAISLGDRFLYQRELFWQNAELMQRTLTELNELSSFDEAIEYIASRFNWDTESSTYQQFLVTLHRRFG